MSSWTNRNFIHAYRILHTFRTFPNSWWVEEINIFPYICKVSFIEKPGNLFLRFSMSMKEVLTPFVFGAKMGNIKKLYNASGKSSIFIFRNTKVEVLPLTTNDIAKSSERSMQLPSSRKWVLIRLVFFLVGIWNAIPTKQAKETSRHFCR